MVSNDTELRMIAAQITMKASAGAEDLCSRYSSVSRMLGNMFNGIVGSLFFIKVMILVHTLQGM